MRYKDLKACLESLKRWQANTALDLGLKETLQRVESQLRKLSRHPNPNRHEVVELVRQLSETLWKAFSKR
jgi:hypothetical protein